MGYTQGCRVQDSDLGLDNLHGAVVVSEGLHVRILPSPDGKSLAFLDHFWHC
jgi:hypothetical protein